MYTLNAGKELLTDRREEGNGREWGEAETKKQGEIRGA